MFCEKALSHDLGQEQEVKWLHPSIFERDKL